MTTAEHEALEKSLQSLRDTLTQMICDLNRPAEMWFHRKSENMYRVLARSKTVKVGGAWMHFGVVTYVRWDLSDLTVYSKFTHEFDVEFSKIERQN